MKKRPQQVTTWFSVLSAFIATFAFAACTPVLSRGSSGAEYAVIDSGLMGDTSLHDKPVWIDNDRILYVEQTNEKRIRASDGYQYNARRVVLWDLQTRQITRMHELTGFLCYRNGYFHSALWDIGDPERFPVKHTYGRLDDALGTVDTEWKTMSFDNATCRPKSESSPTNPLLEWVKGKTVTVLAEIGGILVLDGEKENSLRNLPVSFHPQGAANGIAMPFNSREHHIQGYHPFKGAYFILGTYFVRVPGHPDGGYGKSPWPEGAVRPYWWLYRDGRVVRETLKPSRDPYDTSVLPFRDGIAWHIGFVRGEGLYVTDARGERQAVAGFVQQVVTSPDGCRIAMNHRRSINDPWTTGTLKVIELCKGERK